jgi:hypothetical protein
MSFIWNDNMREKREANNIGAFCLRMSENRSVRLQMADLSEAVNSIYLPGTITFSHLAVKK